MPPIRRFWINLFALLAMAVAVGLLVTRNLEGNQPRQVASLSDHANKRAYAIADTAATTPAKPNDK